MRMYGIGRLHSLSAIFFLNGSRWGIVLLVILGTRPWQFFCGLVGLAAAQGLLRLAGGAGEDPGGQEPYVVNPFLVGLAAGAATELSWGGAGLAAGGGAAALAISALVSRLAEGPRAFPVLSLPFSLTTLMLYLVTGHRAAMAVPDSTILAGGFSTKMLAWLAGYVQSLGAVVFTPDAAAGTALALLILSRSPILFGLSLFGYAVATGASALLGTAVPSQAVGFNGILTAMALGGLFFVPSRQSLRQAALGVFLAVLMTAAIAAALVDSGLPVLTLPFVAATWAILALGRVTNNPMLAGVGAETPEALLEAESVRRLRFPETGPQLHLPFAGQWTVWQGVAGPWTHRGPWQHAFDFVITDNNEKMFAGTGSRLTEYYAYGKPVLSPCSGRVVAVVNDMPDNPIGQVDQERRWGNLVILAHADGTFIEISHFAAGSITVFAGQWVPRGTVLGLCGNSGYSPAPHIHIQVQPTAVIGAATLPFNFAGCLTDGDRQPCALPTAGQRVSALWPDPEMEQVTDLRLGQVFQLRVLDPDADSSAVVIRVEMDADGATCLASDTGRLYFFRRDDGLIFYRLAGSDLHLRAIFTALPRIPHYRSMQAQWRDRVSAGTLVRGLRHSLLALVGVWFPQAVALSTCHQFTDEHTLETRIHSQLAGIDIRARVVFGKMPLFRQIDWNGQVLVLQRAVGSQPAIVETRPQQLPGEILQPVQAIPYPEVTDAMS